MDSLQVQALAIVIMGASTSIMSAYKMWRNHERRRGITLARWYGLGAGVLLTVTYTLLVFEPIGLVPGVGRVAVMIGASALLVYTVSV